MRNPGLMLKEKGWLRSESLSDCRWPLNVTGAPPIAKDQKRISTSCANAAFNLTFIVPHACNTNNYLCFKTNSSGIVLKSKSF